MPRKSTSGLHVAWGTSFLKFSSTNQPTIATSTQEFEYYRIVSYVATGVGVQQLLADFGIVVELHVYPYASAGLRLCKRQGFFRVKHFAVQFLWVQAVIA